ncbi:pantetheine-phosphate adenylyltransferase [Chitinophaga sp. SYP-B3965]|uniref:pantetheine-phosphate adenylyltransferase n=1 Tax=Chitinophaga sp. SYP-B3965 TaxID=2663120 RepID=UPI001299B924|nr:pantetheine-phosphate adenylyltransferase [Chitinophaga sp. SYP-B3965]MRG45616.1 pantetheine-phosphate adenylyltransferase [Chitinophaga sp. SYP-B3965]
MQRICLFPGTFDPVTLGHTDIIDRALPLFDELVIGIGINSSKVPMFTVEQRVEWIREIYKHEPKIKVASYEGLTVNFCKEINAQFILRGIRYVSDFEYEKAIADINRKMDHEVETIFLTCSPEYSTIASTLVRDVIRYKGDAAQFLPDVVANAIKLKPSSI